MTHWWYGWVKVDIYYSSWSGKFVWFMVSDRGANQGMYCQRTLGLDELE